MIVCVLTVHPINSRTRILYNEYKHLFVRRVRTNIRQQSQIQPPQTQTSTHSFVTRATARTFQHKSKLKAEETITYWDKPNLQQY